MNVRPAALLFVAGLLWTAQGESANPMLSARELPATIVQVCRGDCLTDAHPFGIHWLASTPRGALYLVTRAGCDAHACRAWLVQKTRHSVDTLLSIEGRFRLVHTQGVFPGVEVKRDLSNVEFVYSRYAWRGAAYVRIERERRYRVDGVECGTVEECDQAAQAAFRAQDTDRAVRIWEKVQKVAWI